MDSRAIGFGIDRQWKQLAALGSTAWNAWVEWDQKQRLEEPAMPVHYIDFHNTKFEEPVDFSSFRFPHNVDFGSAKFDAEVSFENAIFSGQVKFDRTSFAGGASFTGARFQQECSFESASFSGDVEYPGVRFDKRTVFWDASFLAAAVFDGARFSDSVEFLRAQFTEAYFREAVFHAASFEECAFEKKVEFERARFQEFAFFAGAQFPDHTTYFDCEFEGDATFQEARFAGVVDFTTAVFSGAAVFDGAHFDAPPNLAVRGFAMAPTFTRASFGFSDRGEAEASYRSLKRLAATAQDHRTELDLFALETRARRSNRLRWGRPQDWIELLASHLYQLTSDYGRSVLRPVFGLILSLFVFAFLFAQIGGEGWRFWDWHRPVGVAALAGLLPFGQTRTARLIIEEGLCGGLRDSPRSDCLSMIYGLSAIEGLIGAVLLFLLVLGIRNMFRIK